MALYVRLIVNRPCFEVKSIDCFMVNLKILFLETVVSSLTIISMLCKPEELLHDGLCSSQSAGSNRPVT